MNMHRRLGLVFVVALGVAGCDAGDNCAQAPDCDTERSPSSLSGWSSFWCDLGYYDYCDPFDDRYSALGRMPGRWHLVGNGSSDPYRGPGGVLGCPAEMRVVIGSDDEGKPYLGLREVGSDLRIYDRADFIDINGGETCSMVDMSRTEAVKICHRSRLELKNQVSHRVWMGNKLGFGFKFFPAGSEAATQFLTIYGDGQLRYEYFIDERTEISCTFAPASA
jgi:hypothetical protein